MCAPRGLMVFACGASAAFNPFHLCVWVRLVGRDRLSRSHPRTHPSRARSGRGYLGSARVLITLAQVPPHAPLRGHAVGGQHLRLQHGPLPAPAPRRPGGPQPYPHASDSYGRCSHDQAASDDCRSDGRGGISDGYLTISVSDGNMAVSVTVIYRVCLHHWQLMAVAVLTCMTPVALYSCATPLLVRYSATRVLLHYSRASLLLVCSCGTVLYSCARKHTGRAEGEGRPATTWPSPGCCCHAAFPSVLTARSHSPPTSPDRPGPGSRRRRHGCGPLRGLPPPRPRPLIRPAPPACAVGRARPTPTSHPWRCRMKPRGRVSRPAPGGW